MNPRPDLVCANCDWIGSPVETPETCPNCGMAAEDVLTEITDPYQAVSDDDDDEA